MKKLSLLVGGLVLSTAVMAQKPSSDVPMTLEGQVGFNASTLSFDAPAIRFRYFLTDNIAARVTFGIDNEVNRQDVYEFPDFTGGTGEYRITDNSWNAGIGGEYHFAGTDRLSPYVALDIRFGGGTSSFEGTNATSANFPDPVAGDASYLADYSESGKGGFSTFGVGLSGGMDYYFAENFYFGVELGLLWNSVKDKDATVSTTVGGTETTVNVPGLNSSSSINTASMPLVGGATPMTNFRLGWRF